MKKGKIVSFYDYGTIIDLTVQTKKDIVSIPVAHRMFANFIQDEADNNPRKLVGKTIWWDDKKEIIFV